MVFHFKTLSCFVFDLLTMVCCVILTTKGTETLRRFQSDSLLIFATGGLPLLPVRLNSSLELLPAERGMEG